MAKNYYEILGVSKSSSEDEIKKNYRRLAKQYHPDVNKGDKKAEERFKEISEAYETLSDKEKRKQYDMFGAYGPQAGGGGYQWRGTPGQGTPFDFEDLSELLRRSGAQRGGPRSSTTYTTGGFEDLGDIFGDVFGGASRGGRPQGGTQATSKGQDLYYTMEIDFLEAARGTPSKISVPRAGKVEKINVKIPPGVHNGSKIRLAGKGEPGIGRAPAGDLYIEIKVSPHPLFWREGYDVFLEAPISVGEAILGATIRILTLEGSAHLKIPAGTPSGQKFRLKEKGVLNPETKQYGDLYMITKIVVPKQIDERSRALIEEFEKLNPMNLRKDLF